MLDVRVVAQPQGLADGLHQQVGPGQFGQVDERTLHLGRDTQCGAGLAYPGRRR
ncbi:hypothetical protein OHA21_17385 [Actinoplanes sp. NBC_00393]|uniref:hypothetical protein n=1 Tax=Actinoplanes sp. NBC_00393 TaxID=2975953 RepID=UPI002E1AD495